MSFEDDSKTTLSPSQSSVLSTRSVISRQGTPVDIDGLSYPSKLFIFFFFLVNTCI